MPAPLHRERARERLKRRVDAFLISEKRMRAEVAGFAAALGDLGRTVIIGGMLRDLSISGPRGFKSDVDFVVDASSLAAYDRFVRALGAKPNRFGGHAVRLDHWMVEVWPLQRTWAFVEGHVPVERVEDLLQVTFFDWDAVLYDMSDRRVIAGDDYFDRLSGRLVDLNLEPNPNPLGSTVRAFRYACRWDARFGERLAVYVARQVADLGWGRLVAYENRAFADSCLASVDGEQVVAFLKKYGKGGGGPLRLSLPSRD